MDDRTRPDTNVVLLRRKGDASEAERERVASTIFAEPDDVATFSRGNLVPPRPDARDANEEPASSPDPFFDRLEASSKADEPQRAELADHDESTDAYFDRLALQSPAEMSTNGASAMAASPLPGSALLPADLTRPSRHHGRVRGRLIPPALAIQPWASLRRSWFARPSSVAALGALAALVVGIAVIDQPGSSGGQRQQSQREASATSFEPLRPDVLAASANPFGATALVHRPITHVRRPHPSNAGHPRSHRAGASTSGRVHTTVDHVVAAKYTPAQHTSTSVGVTPDTQSSSATASTTPATPPPAPTHSSSSSGSGSGSSSASANPSKATLRSLVTGAGTCSCQ